MKNILVPVDFSKSSLEVASFAYEMADRCKATLTIMHSYYMPSIEAGMNNDLQTSSELKQLLEDKIKALQSQIEAENPDSFAKINVLVTYGFASDEIANTAESIHADLIIMSSGGAHGVVGKITGSVAGNVFNDVRVPLLLLPLNWKRKHLNKIVFSTDFEPIDNTTTSTVLSIAKNYNSELIFLHVLKSGSTEDEKAALKFSVDNKLNNSGYEKMSFSFAEGEDVVEVLKAYAENSSADLIVITKRKRSFLEKLFTKSRTEKLIFDASIPLLALKN